MKDTFQIRRAEADDAAEVSRLSQELGYPTSTAEIAARLTALLPQPEQFVAVAENGASLLGWISAERRMLLESGERAEMRTISDEALMELDVYTLLIYQVRK